jgi:hypothetical protein
MDTQEIWTQNVILENKWGEVAHGNVVAWEHRPKHH